MVAEMEVGHPVTVPSGAHGIIIALRSNGMTEVGLVGGATVRVPHTELKNYFDTPLFDTQIPEGTVIPDIAQSPSIISGTRAQIITILKASGGKRLSAKEIHARGNFESPVQVYNELSVLCRKHAVIDREKRPSEEGQAVYQYWLIPGAKLPQYLEADVSELEVRKNDRLVTTHSFTPHVDSVVTKGDELIFKPVLPEAYSVVLRDLIVKRDKLNAAITALELLMGQV